MSSVTRSTHSNKNKPWSTNDYLKYFTMLSEKTYNCLITCNNNEEKLQTLLVRDLTQLTHTIDIISKMIASNTQTGTLEGVDDVEHQLIDKLNAKLHSNDQEVQMVYSVRQDCRSCYTSTLSSLRSCLEAYSPGKKNDINDVFATAQKSVSKLCKLVDKLSAIKKTETIDREREIEFDLGVIQSIFYMLITLVRICSKATRPSTTLLSLLNTPL